MKCFFMMLSFVLVSFLGGCEAENKLRVPDVPDKPVVIVFENDVHCAVDGYAKLAGLYSQQKALTPYVSIVSCGDFVQGDVIGSVSRGENIVDIMNRVGYDVVTLGNHEFDFGVSQMFELMEVLDASVVDANFRDVRTGGYPFPAYQIIRYGEVDIAYLGVTTTTTATNVSPKTFLDENGELVYDFSLDVFYERIQSQVDEARAEGADYVVVLSHLGNEDKGEHPSSLDLIARTKGIDVVLDGHEHYVIPDTMVHNQEGVPVLLNSAGTKFSHIGLLTLSLDGAFSSSLVSADAEVVPVNQEICTYVEAVKEKALADGQRVVGVNEVNLSIYDALGNRIVRNQETAIGNFSADAFREVLNADVALVNGGGIRADLPLGEITFNDLLSVFPFNNTACTATLTGQQLLDALEFAVSFLPLEDGTFMQVSGLKFEVNALVPSPVKTDEDDLFAGVGSGSRRIGNLRILEKESGEYQPVDLSRRYTLASFDYLLKELGGSGVFRYVELQDENLGQDVEILASYVGQFLNGKIDDRYSKVEGRIVMK